MAGMELIEAGRDRHEPHPHPDPLPEGEGIRSEIDAFLRLLAEWAIEDRFEEREETDA